jgi:hypothetical protein
MQPWHAWKSGTRPFGRLDTSSACFFINLLLSLSVYSLISCSGNLLFHPLDWSFINFLFCQIMISHSPSNCLINLPLHQHASSSTCHFNKMSFHQNVIPSKCQFLNITFHQHSILSTCHFINTPFHQHAISSTCRFINMPLHQHQHAISSLYFFCNMTFH